MPAGANGSLGRLTATWFCGVVGNPPIGDEYMGILPCSGCITVGRKGVTWIEAAAAVVVIVVVVVFLDLP